MPDSTALARREATGQLLATNEGWQRFKDIAAVLVSGNSAQGRLLPECIQTVQQAQACMLLAFSLGYDLIGAMAAMQHMVPIRGKIGFGYEWKLARVYETVPTWRYGITHSDDKRCEGWFQRASDHEKFTVSYTIEQARAANLLKKDSAWETNAVAMLRKTVIVQGIRLTAPDALIGVPKEPWEGEDGDDTQLENTPAREPSGAVVVEEPAAPGADGTPPTANGGPVAEGKGESPSAPGAADGDASAKEVFYSEAQKKGWNTQHGPSMFKLVQELLTEEDGQVPQIQQLKVIPSGDWRRAFARLVERYPNGKPDTWGKAAAPQAAAPPANPPAAAKEAPPEPAAAPPAAVVAGPMNDLEAERAQMSSREYLLELAEELVRLEKMPRDTVLKEAYGVTWFIFGEILKSNGFITDKGTSKSMALQQQDKFPEHNLTPEETYQLSMAVRERLRALAVKGGRR